MVRIAICDDDKQELAHLDSMLEVCRRSHEWTAVPFNDPEALLKNVVQDTPYDIYLLDVVMLQMTGIELIQRLRILTGRTPLVIFLTNSREFAVDAFQVGALHYLLKPVSIEQLSAALDRAMTYLAPQKSEPLLIAVPTASGITTFDAADLLWAEVRNHTTHYFLRGSRSAISRTLRISFEKAAKALLDLPQYYRCHQSFIINLDQVERIVPGNFHLKDGSCIPISRSHQREAERAWLTFLEVHPV